MMPNCSQRHTEIMWEQQLGLHSVTSGKLGHIYDSDGNKWLTWQSFQFIYEDDSYSSDYSKLAPEKIHIWKKHKKT